MEGTGDMGSQFQSHSSLSSRVFKAMGLFAGVQGMGIVCSVLRIKLVALWLGPAGVALFGIFNNALDMVKSISQLGIRSSSVREIACKRSDPESAGLIVSVVRRWGLMLGILGAALMVVLAPFLSRYTFGSGDMILSYMILGAGVFVMSVSAAEEAVLQGLEKLRLLARASMWGMCGGLLVSIPMFYYWRLDSVVPSILAYALVTNAVLLVGRVKIARTQVKIGLRQTLSLGRQFITLGIFMTAAEAISLVLSYVFIAWLNMTGGESEVGFYQAGYTMVNRYPGLVIGAIAVEFYPRLASAIGSGLRTRVFVAHEMRLLTVVLTGFVALFVPLSEIAVRLLYSSEFAVAVPFVAVAMVGVLLRGVSCCMAYVILAKGDGKIYLLTETLSAIAGLLLNMLAFRLWGIKGLGLSYTLWYLLYVVIVSTVYYRRYGLHLPGRLIAAVTGAVVSVSLCVIVAMTAAYLWALVPGFVIAAFCGRSAYSFWRGSR